MFAPEESGGGARPSNLHLHHAPKSTPSPGPREKADRAAGYTPQAPSPTRLHAYHPQPAPRPRLPEYHAPEQVYNTSVPAARASSNTYSSYTTGRQAPTVQHDYTTGTANTVAMLARQAGVEKFERTAQVNRALDAERAVRMQALLSSDVGQGPKPNRRRPKEAHGQVDRMSWEEYNALSDRQRAAVDFNTSLVEAVHKDKVSQDVYEPSSRQREIYDEAIVNMFGEDRGSERWGEDTYAPETLSLLRQLKLDDAAGDIDDYLGLKSAITTNDLKYIPKKDTVPGPVSMSGATPIQIDRIELTKTLADNTRKMELAVTKGNQMLQSMEQTLSVNRNNLLGMIGGIENVAAPALGYNQENRIPDGPQAGQPKDANTYFQDAFDILANKKYDKDTDKIMGRISGNLDDHDYKAFITYADYRSANSERYDLELGSGDKVNYRSPEEFRSMLKLGGDQS